MFQNIVLYMYVSGRHTGYLIEVYDTAIRCYNEVWAVGMEGACIDLIYREGSCSILSSVLLMEKSGIIPQKYLENIRWKCTT